MILIGSCTYAWAIYANRAGFRCCKVKYMREIINLTFRAPFYCSSQVFHVAPAKQMNYIWTWWCSCIFYQPVAEIQEMSNQETLDLVSRDLDVMRTTVLSSVLSIYDNWDHEQTDFRINRHNSGSRNVNAMQQSHSLYNEVTLKYELCSLNILCSQILLREFEKEKIKRGVEKHKLTVTPPP